MMNKFEKFILIIWYRNYDVNDVVLNWGSSHNISALQRLESQVSVTTWYYNYFTPCLSQTVRSIEDPEKNPKAVDNWIDSIR